MTFIIHYKDGSRETYSNRYDEDDETNENLKQFKEKYNISNQRQVIVIKNGFKKENFDIETIKTEETLNKYRIYYENEDQNIETFKRIFQTIKEIKKGTKQNIDVRYKDYFTINQSFLNGDWIKCEYPELNKSTCLVSKNNTNITPLIISDAILTQFLSLKLYKLSLLS